VEAAKPQRPEFRVLGPLQVLVAGRERPVPGDKLQALLARLLLEPNRAIPTDRLIDDLWGERAPATARQSLHTHVARLRRVLVTEGVASSPLEYDGRGYVLHVEEDQLDSARFRALLARARDERRRGRAAAARELYAQALALWRGPALEGVELARAEAERAELEGLRLAALEERIDADLELGRHEQLVPELERLVHDDPLRERSRAQLMLALYAAGRQADALAAYQDARRALDELGLVPGPALRELERSILTQDPQLATAPPRGVAAPRRRVLRILAAAVAAAVLLAVAGAIVLDDQDAPVAARAGPPEVFPNQLVEIDPATSRVLSATTVGQGPDSIAATPGALWVANVEDRTVSRVGLRDKEVRTVGGVPVAHNLVSALNGDVWLSSFEEPYVTLIAPGGELLTGAHDVAGAPRRVRLPGSAEGLAVGGGYLWITSPSDSGGRDTVSRIDLRTRRVVSSVPVGHVPAFVTFGYGSAWVANYDGESVSVIRPGSEKPETIPVEGGPLGLAAGEGAIWVVAYWLQELVRIDPETRRVVERVPVGEGPLAVAVGAGAVWVTNRDSRTLSKVDPATNRVSRTIRLGASPYGVHFAHGRVWVTTQRCGSSHPGC
jgi:YVTN family beta-propeller protein